MMPDERSALARDGQRPTHTGRWAETSALVDAALELAPDERAQYLDRACSTGDLRAEVELLVRACENSSGFLDGAASTFAAPLFAGDLSPREQDEAESLERLRNALADRYSIELELGRGGRAAKPL